MQCRACRRFNCEVVTDMSSVMPTDGKTLYDYFNDCTQLEAKARDDLPQVLCMTCTKHLKQAYGFRELARRSDDELRRTLALIKNETLMDLDPEQDTEATSIVPLIIGSPKREADFICAEDSQTLDDIESATLDPLSVSIKSESPPQKMYMHKRRVSKNELDTHLQTKHKYFPRVNNLKKSILNTKNDKNPVDELQLRDDSNVQQTQIEIERLYETGASTVDIAKKPRRPRSRKGEEKLNSNKLNSEIKFICAYCPREFKNSYGLKLHEQSIHRPETIERKPCPICQKVLDPRYLKIHIKTLHSKERKYDCDICGNSYKSFALLSSHKYLHFNRKHICNVCNKGFIGKSDLKVHMRSHTGEKPFACHLCDERFKIKVRLTYHLQRHAGIKQTCEVCGKQFACERLKTHSYIHTGMPYRCTMCEYKSSGRNKFRIHLKRMHKKTLTEDELSEMFKKNTGRCARITEVKVMGTTEIQEQDHSNQGLKPKPKP